MEGRLTWTNNGSVSSTNNDNDTYHKGQGYNNLFKDRVIPHHTHTACVASPDDLFVQYIQMTSFAQHVGCCCSSSYFIYC